MSETPQPQLIDKMPDHLRVGAGETDQTHETDAQKERDILELGDIAAENFFSQRTGAQVTETVGQRVVVEPRSPNVSIPADEVTPEMRRNALGAPDQLDAAGRQVPRHSDSALGNLGGVGDLQSAKQEGSEQ